MQQLITYPSQELKSNLEFMSSRVKHLKSYLLMFDEQHNGKRTNMDFSIAQELLGDIKKIEDAIERFNIPLD